MQRDGKRADPTTVVQERRSVSGFQRVFCIVLLSAWPALGTAGAQQHPPADSQHTDSPAKAGAYSGTNRVGGESRSEGQRQNHLGDWLQKHQNMSFVDQENALRREPGFTRLAPETQQRLVQRLQKLDSLPPEQRQRTLSRMEAMERLSPPQREQVRRSAQQLGELPQDRQRMVRRAFRDLRDIPAEQRDPLLNSPRFQSQFSPDERNILGTLLKVEPYQGGHGNVPAYPVPAGR